MEWIDVKVDLPKDGELVLVLVEIPDEKSMLMIHTTPWVFMGEFQRSKGWKIYYISAYFKVLSWCPFTFPKKEEDA